MPSLPTKKKIFVNTSKGLLENRNWTFSVVRYFTWVFLRYFVHGWNSHKVIKKRHSGRFRHIPSYSDIFRLIQTYPDIMRLCKHIKKLFRHFLNPVYLWHIQNSGIIRILAYSKPEAYSEPWYIQNSGTFRTRDIFRFLGYSEPWDIQNRRNTQNDVKHLWRSALRNS